MSLAYIIVTTVLFIAGIIVWVATGCFMADESSASKKDWKIWRAAFPAGLVFVFGWPVVLPLSLVVLFLYFLKDGLDLIFKRNKEDEES